MKPAAMEEYVDRDARTVLCTGHDTAVWEKATIRAMPMSSDYHYRWTMTFDCGRTISKSIAMEDIHSADDALLHMLEDGDILDMAALIAWEADNE